MGSYMKTEDKKPAEKARIEREQDSRKMPVYDIDEPWVQEHIKDFGTEPSFF